MKLSDVVAHLRQYCPTFDGRVAVALEFEPDRGQVRLAVPAAVVMPSDDEAQPVAAYSQNVSIQSVADRFVVVLVVASADPKRGDTTADVLHDLRAELWRALIGWRPGAGYEPIEYVSGEVSHMDRSATYYAMTFSAEFTVGYPNGLPDGATPETWQEYELAGLPALEGLDVDVDVIDPIADPNLKKPGPDGRIEFNLQEDTQS
ncbi:phage tail terminator protein [Castellaniella sp. UC4442_H9]